MSLQIAVAHTGQRLDADPVGFNSIDALKQWTSIATQIPPECQILLTPRGKHVKLQALLTEVGTSYCRGYIRLIIVVEGNIRVQPRVVYWSSVYLLSHAAS